MKLADFVVPDAVIPELAATDRNGAIRELLGALAAAGKIAAADIPEIAKIIIKRENEGSTGFGKGAAVPHVKHACTNSIVAAIGRSSAGIDFTALDRAPVYMVFLLISPPGNDDAHLAAMESIFRHLTRYNFRRFLRQATTQKEIIDLLREADEMPR